MIEDSISRSMLQSAIGSVITLYMLGILACWVGPWLELDLRRGRWRFVHLATHPLVSWLRRVLPSLGPVDLAPAAALMLVWILRIVLVNY